MELKFQDANDIDSKKIKKKKKITERQLSKKDDASKLEEEAGDDDVDIITFYPEKECIPTLGSVQLKNKEVEYFESIFIENIPFLLPVKSNKAYVTALSISYTKEYLVIGTSNG